ncbi:GntR family transcriptional regulator [Rhodovulum imhoffii]|nr:GntR family transcriptional regulator [Rhodovulum imhoffii]
MKTPEHEAIYRKVRGMILFGALPPGQAVTIQGLCAVTGAGATPVRETIRRLTAEGALEALGNRRVCVPRTTSEKLAQIHFLRRHLEPELARLATPHMTDKEIHFIEEKDNEVNIAIAAGDAGGYLEANYRFHFGLYAVAGADVLHHTALSLWVRMGPSLRVVCGQVGTASLPDQHRAVLAALRRRDPAAAARALLDDIDQGYTLVARTLGETQEPLS